MFIWSVFVPFRSIFYIYFLGYLGVCVLDFVLGFILVAQFWFCSQQLIFPGTLNAAKEYL